MTNNKKLSDLNFDTKNANKHTAKGQKALEDSLQKYGAGRSILVDKNNNIIAGNLTAEVFGQIGLEDVQIVESDGKKLIVVKRTDVDINSKAGRELAISDNRASELSLNWDSDALKDIQENFKVDLSEFFSNKELKLLGLDNINLNEEDFEFPDEIKTNIVLGDLFEIGDHRLLCGDSTDSDQVAKLMNGQKADMVFTDPPYGMKLDADYSGMKSEIFKGGIGGKKYDNIKGDHDDFTNELINTIFSHFADTKEVFIWGADYFAELLPNKNDGSWVVWDKRANGNDDITEDESSDKMYGSTFELCWSKNKHKRDIARVKWAGIFGMPSQDTKGRVHPTQKPIELANWFFNKWGKDSDLVADLYLGSGSTMVASHQLNRKCYGMEIEPKYCQVILDRMIKLDPSLKIIKNGKHS